MKGRKLDEVTDAVLRLIDQEIARGNVPFDNVKPRRETFKCLLRDTIERTSGR